MHTRIAYHRGILPASLEAIVRDACLDKREINERVRTWLSEPYVDDIGFSSRMSVVVQGNEV